MGSRRLAISAAWLCVAFAGAARATGVSSTLDRFMTLAPWQHSALVDPAARESLERLPAVERRKRLDALLGADPEDLMARMLRATAEYELGEDTAALVDLDRLPDSGTLADAAILGLRAEVLLDLGRAAEALDASERALAADPGNEFVSLHFAHAWALHLVRHDDAQALRELDQALAGAPDEAVGFWRRSQVLSALDQDERALADLRQAVALDPRQPGWHVDLADGLVNLGQVDAARPAYDEAIRLAPLDARAWARRSRLDIGQGRWDAALDDATRALALDGRPEDQADAYWSRAMTWWRRIDEAQAIADLARGETVAPRRTELPLLRGEIALYRLDWAAAKAAMAHAIELDAGCAVCLSGRAVAEARLGERDAALADARRAAEIAPRNWPVRNDFGLVLQILKDYPGALEQFDLAIRLDGEGKAAAIDDFDVAAWTGRADVHEAMGDHATALREYTALLERLSPSERYIVLKRRAMVYAALGDNPRAIADMRSVMALTPRDPMAPLGLGWLLARSGDLSGAADAYGASRAVREDTRTAQLQADALFDAGRIGEVAEPARVALPGNARRSTYYAVWIYVSRLRARVVDEAAARRELATLAPPHDPRVWSDSLVDFLEGRIDLATLQQRAEDGSADARPGSHCEADFYAAEVALAHGRRDQAMPLLAEAVRTCPSTFFEARAAKAEARLQGLAEAD